MTRHFKICAGLRREIIHAIRIRSAHSFATSKSKQKLFQRSSDKTNSQNSHRLLVKMPKIVVENQSHFEKKLAAHIENSDEPAFLYFVANDDPTTGESWCPDCRESKKAIEEAFEKHPDVLLFWCLVGDRDQWKGVMDHAYRVHPQLNVVGVPTLIRWEKGGSTGSLGEVGCKDPEKVEALIKKGTKESYKSFEKDTKPFVAT